MIRAAKKEKLPVTCDVGVHYVHLSELDSATSTRTAASTRRCARSATATRSRRGLADAP
jgi:dihydroorotase-like cyclic amidohydrolase